MHFRVTPGGDRERARQQPTKSSSLELVHDRKADVGDRRVRTRPDVGRAADAEVLTVDRDPREVIDVVDLGQVPGSSRCDPGQAEEPPVPAETSSAASRSRH